MKIEKGCMAIVINGAEPSSPRTNIGKIVIVGNYIGKVAGFVGRNRWEVDQPINHLTGFHYHCQEKYLQRIDDCSITEENSNKIVTAERA